MPRRTRPCVHGRQHALLNPLSSPPWDLLFKCLVFRLSTHTVHSEQHGSSSTTINHLFQTSFSKHPRSYSVEETQDAQTNGTRYVHTTYTHHIDAIESVYTERMIHVYRTSSHGHHGAPCYIIPHLLVLLRGLRIANLCPSVQCNSHFPPSYATHVQQHFHHVAHCVRPLYLLELSSLDQ